MYEPDCSGGESIMVGTGICHDGRTQLKNVHETLNAVKYEENIHDQNSDHVFQHDNTRCHVACVFKTF